jgi:transposase
VVGIDDRAWKRGHRYETIIRDLERPRIIDVLPDREAATVTAWLTQHPSITVIARDRGAGYKQAATDGCPQGVQVADRWHLVENASAAFLNAERRSMHAIRKAVGTGAVDPASLSAAERRQHSGWLLREAENAAILALAAQGVAIKEIMRRTDKSRGLVRQVVRGARTDMFRSRMSSLDPFLAQYWPPIGGQFSMPIDGSRITPFGILPARGRMNIVSLLWRLEEIPRDPKRTVMLLANLLGFPRGNDGFGTRRPFDLKRSCS